MQNAIYEPVIEKWKEMDEDKFLGNSEEGGLVYELGITPPDPTDRNYVLINVWVHKEIRNITQSITPFEAKVYYCFRVKNDGNSIQSDFYYYLIKYASEQFIELLKQKATHLSLKDHLTGIPSFHALKQSIDTAIGMWDKHHKRTSLN